MSLKMNLNNPVKEVQEKSKKIEVAESRNYEESKEIKRKKNQLNNRIKTVEERIAILEKELEVIQNELVELDFSSERSKELLNEFDLKKKDLDNLMEQWEQISEELLSID
jgi:ATP-binding cassette subfamily F protein 3